MGNQTSRKLAHEVRENLTYMKEVVQHAQVYVRDIDETPPEIAWLLDNRFLAEREGRDACRHLRYLKGKNLNELYQDIRAWILSWNDTPNEEDIEVFLKSKPRDEHTLWSFETIFKCALVAELTSLCDKLFPMLQSGKESPEENDFAAERLIAWARANGQPVNKEILERASAARIWHEQMEESFSHIFKMFGKFAMLKISEIIYAASPMEQILMRDTDYRNMSEESRVYYRRCIEKTAKRRNQDEPEVAKQAMQRAEAEGRHVGFYIVPKPGKFGSRYMGITLGLTFITSITLAYFAGFWWILLLILPVWSIVKNVVDFLSVRFIPPMHIPRMALKAGIPDEGKTICVISALLTSVDSVQEYVKKLEHYYLTNRDAGKNLNFGILADLKDAKVAVREQDQEILDSARNAIAQLNKKYQDRFVFFSRNRVYNRRDGIYMGWERKRGALHELVSYLSGSKSGIIVFGDEEKLLNTHYIITLDADTRLNIGSAKKMVGAMLHPLCRAQIDPQRRVVVDGYGVLQPRMGVDLQAANRSLFSRLFAGLGGIDPYGNAASDIYQDVFGEGNFTGKGILDVHAAYTCLDHRLPEGQILSHDLLEGSYLRAGYLSDVELTDGFPYKVMSFYDRQHRWIRGDWQIIGWLTGTIGNNQNPINTFSKWKIFENLRRSVTPAFILLSLIFGSLPVMVTAILTLISNLLLTFAAELGRGGGEFTVRYNASIVYGVKGAFWQTLIQLIFLPYDAFLSTSAMVLALYRLCISKRNLLSWVTAAEADAKSMKGGFLWRMWFAPLSGLIALFLFNPIGILWIFAPWIASWLSHELINKNECNADERAFLIECARGIWKYFEDFVTEEEHFLPPDNWQEIPANGLASRTSPTNIGLGLLCAVAAMDLNLTTQERALQMICDMLKSMEDLPKWNGHLFNWYDTKTAEPLSPRWVSTVDSGNLAACLIALDGALAEIPNTEKLRERTRKLLNMMDFIILYDKERALFYIGYDTENNRATEGWYDMMESEARQTSYFAVARGIVPRKHWEHLGRARVRSGKYAGMASWTGTMFEYFMPNLLMPCIPNSALYESCLFALYCQKERTRDKDIPWGISESAFFAFDTDMNYQYKAHGVAKLGLKRGLDEELVVSPYSTYLALSQDKDEAIENLRRLFGLGLSGRYGLFESVDYTRVKHGSFSPVKTFMAHHLGMSLLSIDNTLMKNIMVRRFMADAEMAAHQELLEEKVPINPVVMDIRVQNLPERPCSRENQNWGTAERGYHIWQPHCTILSGGKYRTFLTDTGLSQSSYGDICLTRFDRKQIGGAQGMSFFISSDKLFSLTPAPYYDDTVSYESAFDSDSVRIHASVEDLKTTVETWVPDMENAERRTVTIENTGATARNLTLVVYFEPVLARSGDYFSHPSFSKLFLETKIDDKCVYVRRRPRIGKEEQHLAFLTDADKVNFDTCKEQVLGRGGIHALLGALKREPGNTEGAVLDPCIFVRIPLTIGPKECKTISFVLSYAKTSEEACNIAQRVIQARYGRNGILDELARRFQLTPAQVSEAMQILCELVFLTDARRAQAQYIEKNKIGQDGLWKYGISGDLPIITARFSNVEYAKNIGKLIAQHALLSRLGILVDLVILLTDSGDYMRPQRSAIDEILKRLHLEGKFGSRGGVHLLNLNQESEDETLILSASPVVFDAVYGHKIEESIDLPLSRYIPRYDLFDADKLKVTWLEDNVVELDTTNGLPPVAWSNMLASKEFGYLATDSGCGHMWIKNARENKITPWLNDPLAVLGGETLSVGGVSLFAAPDGAPCKVRFGLGSAQWEKWIFDTRFTVTAFVSHTHHARILFIESDAPAEIEFYSELVLGNGNNTSQIVTFFDETSGAICAQNAFNRDFTPQIYGVMTRGQNMRFTCNAPSWFSGNLDAACGAGYIPCIGLALNLSKVDDVYRGTIISAWGKDASEFRGMSDLDLKILYDETLAWWDELCHPVQIKTPDAAMDRYINGWALYQVAACRLFGRTSLYQSGGAFGFRDQLQDACAFAAHHAEILRDQILAAAAHQYVEGDVQHWWHEFSEFSRGVRTRITDDLLWLPYAVCEYIEKSGDRSILDIEIPYITSKNLEANEHDRYETPEVAQSGSIKEHCIRAIDTVLKRGAGKNGLAKIGGGDWNDGMNMVGSHGYGESTWLSWFIELVLRRWCIIEPNDEYLNAANDYGTAATNAWDGKWFLRGTYDNGIPLGSHDSDECKIDSIAQSFSVFSQKCSDERKNIAISSAIEMLVDREHRIIRLFTPAFDKTQQNPGYIKGYLAGIRENGGQYTHGAIWLAQACLQLGRGDDGYELLSLILPETHDRMQYRIEPYVLAGDVYDNSAHQGRGGWSWYTGSAAWFWRVVTENLLGLHVRDGKLCIEPKLPNDWQGFKAQIFLNGEAQNVDYKVE